MLTPIQTAKVYIQSVRSRSRGALCLCVPGWLKEAQPRGRMLALVVVLSLTVALVAACVPPSTASPLEPATRVGSQASLRLKVE